MRSPLHYENYQDFLKSLVNHQDKRTSLSLRAVAAKVGLSPSHFSRIINGKRPFTLAMSSRLCEALDLSSEEHAHLTSLIAAESLDNSRKPVRSAAVAAELVNKDVFAAVADWQHFAILSLTKLRDFEPSSQWIAKRLGIDTKLAKQSVDRLVTVGLLQRIEGRLQARQDGEIETAIDIPSAAVRENHRQNMVLAEKALKTLKVENREFINCSFAMDSYKIPKAKKRLRIFLDKFVKDFEQDAANDVFQINIQFFPITKQEIK